MLRRSYRSNKSPRVNLRVERLEDRSTPSATAGLATFDNLVVDPTQYSSEQILVHWTGPASPPRGPLVPIPLAHRATGTASSALRPPGLPSAAENLGSGLFLVPVADGMTVAAALDLYGSRPGVDYVAPDFRVTVERVPSDTSFAAQYGLNNTGQSGGTADADIDAAEGWDVTTGTGRVIVAVIDTGMDYNHPDLYLNVWINQAEIPADVRARLVDVDRDGRIGFRDLADPRNIGAGKITDLNRDGRIDAGDLLYSRAQGGWVDGLDGDRDGLLDDLVGWDYANGDRDPYDDNGHGTHVSGTIGAVGNNGIGVAGVAWNVQLMPLKFMKADGSGSVSDAIRALNFAVAHGAKVSNHSYSGTGSYAPFATAIASARAAGHVVVAAAGNAGRNNDAVPSYPASYAYDNVIAVAATDRNDRLASFSNYGVASVDLAAPGASILSTLPGGRYGSYSGTSMATPHVAGAVALLMDRNPGWTYKQVIDRIYSSVDRVATLGGKVATGGRLNLARALGR